MGQFLVTRQWNPYTFLSLIISLIPCPMFHGSIVDLQKENESKKFPFFLRSFPRWRKKKKAKIADSDFVAALFLSVPVTMWKIGCHFYLFLFFTYTEDLVLSKVK